MLVPITAGTGESKAQRLEYLLNYIDDLVVLRIYNDDLAAFD